ncbi:MAG: ABC transporter permease [Bdellovibrionota bacterium]
MSDRVRRMMWRTGSFELACAALSAFLLAFLVGPLLAVLLADPKTAFLSSWGDSELLAAVGVSLGCSLVATLFGVLFATPLAYLLERRSFRGKRLVLAVLSLPLVIPHPVVGIALLLVFARHRLLGALIEGRLGIEIVGAAPGVIMAMFFVSVPLIVRSAQEGFRSVDERLEHAAMSLGATPWRAFRRVSLPLARPAILSGAISAFARSVSEFGSIAILAYFPRTAPVLIWDRFNSFGLRGAVPATAFLLLVTLVLFLLWTLAEERRKRGA